jgi:hypothetical protein
MVLDNVVDPKDIQVKLGNSDPNKQQASIEYAKEHFGNTAIYDCLTRDLKSHASRSLERSDLSQASVEYAKEHFGNTAIYDCLTRDLKSHAS